MNSLEYIKKTIELISLGDNINIKARLIHLKRHIEEDYEKHEKDMNSFAEWCSVNGWEYQMFEGEWWNERDEIKTTAQLREMWKKERFGNDIGVTTKGKEEAV